MLENLVKWLSNCHMLADHPLQSGKDKLMFGIQLVSVLSLNSEIILSFLLIYST